MTRLSGVPTRVLTGPPSAAAIASAPNKRIFGSVFAAGTMVFAGTSSGGQAVLFRWKDFTSPAGYNVLNQASIFINNLFGITADAINGSGIYYCAARIVSSTCEIDVYKAGIDPFTDGGNIITGTLGTANNPSLGILCGIATDGTTIYVLSPHAAENAWMGKWDMSGVAHGNFQVPNPASGTSPNGATLTYDPVGAQLFGAGGTFGNFWAMKVSAAFGTPTVLHLGGVFGMGQTSFFDQTNFWCYELGGLNLMKIDSGVTTLTTISMGGSLGAVSPDPGGQYIWVAYSYPGATLSKSGVKLVDKTGATVWGPVDTGVPLLGAIWGQWPIGCLAITSPASQSIDSTAVFVPAWTDLSVTPPIIEGHGATG